MGNNIDKIRDTKLSTQKNIGSYVYNFINHQYNLNSLYKVEKQNNIISNNIKSKNLSIIELHKNSNRKLDNSKSILLYKDGKFSNLSTISSRNFFCKNTVTDSNTKSILKNKFNEYEYKNIIYYPNSTKEWFNSVYSFNKSYTKALVTLDVLTNALFKSYLNMTKPRQINNLKRRRARKDAYSSNKVHLSRAEVKHTNTSVIILLYIYNRPKFLYEEYTRKLVNFLKAKEMKSSVNTSKNLIVKKNRL